MRGLVTLITISLLAMASTKGALGENAYSLREAIRIALENNNELNAARYFVSSEKKNIGIARSSLLPRISFEEEFIRTDNPPTVFFLKLNQERFSERDFEIVSLNDPDAISNYKTTLSVSQTLFDARSFIAKRIAEERYLSHEKAFERKREEIAIRVIAAYLSVRTAEEFVRVAESATSDAREHKRIAEARYKADLGLYSDVLRASTALSEAEQKLVSAMKNLKVARMNLGVLLGYSEPVSIEGDIPDIPFKELDHYLSASKSREDLKSAEIRSTVAEKNLRLAISGYLPTAGIGASYQLNDHSTPFGSEGKSMSVMAFLKWDIFNGGAREYEIAKARLKIKEEEESLSALKKSISLSLYEAYLGVEEAEKNLELARSAVQTAEEGRRLVRTRFENSLSPLVDLLDAQLNLDRARATLVVSENEYALSKFVLSYESGTILEELGI
jgi:outer membrane protein TolC